MAMKLTGRLVTALVLTLQVFTVLGSGYELRVRVHGYRNPTGTCHDCFFDETQTQPGCCDQPSETENCDLMEGWRCDNFFGFCQRTLETPVNDSTCPMPLGQRRFSIHMDNSDDVTFAEDMFGIDNPLLFTSDLWQGVQVFVEVFDFDNDDSHDLVDVFAIVVDMPPGPNYTEIATYSGFYGFGELDLSFQVICSTGFTGPDCSVEVDNCANNNCAANQVCVNLLTSFSCDCRPGFTDLPTCLTNIDDCVSVDCGTNQQCIDGINSYSCECVPGFIGDDCLTNENDCIGINCGNGVCQDGNQSATCECNPGYTGQNCSIDINECEDSSCSGNSQCVDGIATFSCICIPGFSGEDCAAEQTAAMDLGTIIGAAVGALVGLILIVVILILVMVFLMRKRRSSVKSKPAERNYYEDTLTREDKEDAAAVSSGEQCTSEEGVNRTGSVVERELKNPIYGMSDENNYDEVAGAIGSSKRPITTRNGSVVERELKNPIYGMSHAEEAEYDEVADAPLETTAEEVGSKHPPSKTRTGSIVERELKNPIYGMSDADDEMTENSIYGRPGNPANIDLNTSAKKVSSENEYAIPEGPTYSRIEDGKTLDYKIIA